MFIEKNSIEVITIKDEIKVVGLSLEKAGWSKNFGKIGELWGVYSDEHRKKTNVKIPVVEYGFIFTKPDDPGDYDYIVGSEVVDFGEIEDELIAFTIPAGRYIKDSFNAKDFGELVCDTLGNRNGIVKNWEDENNVNIVNMPPFSVTGIVVYPVQEMVKPEGEVTNENFKHDGRIKSEYPSMYTLTPIE